MNECIVQMMTENTHDTRTLTDTGTQAQNGEKSKECWYTPLNEMRLVERCWGVYEVQSNGEQKASLDQADKP